MEGYNGDLTNPGQVALHLTVMQYLEIRVEEQYGPIRVNAPLTWALPQKWANEVTH